MSRVTEFSAEEAARIEPNSVGTVEIRELQPGEEQEWDEFVHRSASGTFCHLSGWKTIVERSLGHRCIFLVARINGSISGVFPLSLVRNPVFGDCLVSLPLAMYAGVCAEDELSYFGLLKAGQELAERRGVKYLEMRNKAEDYPLDLPTRELYVTFSQDLTPGPEKLLQALPRDTRYMVRKSLKGSLEWVQDLSIDDFYEIYAKSVHQLGTPVFSKKLFSQLLEVFPGRCKIAGVRKNGTAIAGVMSFYFRDQVMPYYGGALREFNSDAPNNFMYWNLIAQSCGEGLRTFDFGRSKIGTGSYKFKSAWSMEEKRLPYRYHLVAAKEVPQMSPVDAKFQLPVATWKKLPFSWTKVIGPRVIRWVPSV